MVDLVSKHSAIITAISYEHIQRDSSIYRKSTRVRGFSDPQTRYTIGYLCAGPCGIRVTLENEVSASFGARRGKRQKRAYSVRRCGGGSCRPIQSCSGSRKGLHMLNLNHGYQCICADRMPRQYET
ncbi:MAG: hypothetical protein PVG94_09405 [Gammaproteobacteria bacterium]